MMYRIVAFALLIYFICWFIISTGKRKYSLVDIAWGGAVRCSSLGRFDCYRFDYITTISHFSTRDIMGWKIIYPSCSSQLEQARRLSLCEHA